VRLPIKSINGIPLTLSRSFKIAKGAAFAAGNKVTVEEFMRRGAAFGIQMRQSSKSGKGNPHNLWDNEAYFVLSSVGDLDTRSRSHPLYRC
jgi:hypothetical protein